MAIQLSQEIGGLFFIGDSKDGFGKIYYTLRDSIFDLDHTSQLIDALDLDTLTPFVLVLQTDGGPDHSIKFLTTKLASLALFVKLDLDHFLVLCGAPNGSAFNTIERAIMIVQPITRCRKSQLKKLKWMSGLRMLQRAATA